MEWFDLIDETLRAFLIIPLYSILNKLLKHDGENVAKHTFKVGVIAFALYTLFSVGVLIYGSVLVAAMNPAEVDLAVTNHYLQLETVAFMVGILPNFFNVVFVVVCKDKNVYFRRANGIVRDCRFLVDSGNGCLRNRRFQYHSKCVACRSRLFGVTYQTRLVSQGRFADV